MRNIKIANEQIDVVVNDEKAAKRKKIDNRKTLAFLARKIECDMNTYGKMYAVYYVYQAFCVAEKKYGGEVGIEITPEGNAYIELGFKYSSIGALIKINEQKHIERMLLTWKHKGITKRRDFYYFKTEHNQWFVLKQLADEEIERLLNIFKGAE